MRLGKQITIALLALPAAELVAFIAVTMVIGVTTALALMILTSFAGALVLRHVGRTGLAQLRRTMADPDAPEGQGGGARLLLGLGGILLVLPGFITDLMGALLLLPPVRRVVGATIRRWSLAPRDGHRGDAVVDLDPGEWLELGEARLPPAEDARKAR